jgi:hypothetical protein
MVPNATMLTVLSISSSRIRLARAPAQTKMNVSIHQEKPFKVPESD